MISQARPDPRELIARLANTNVQWPHIGKDLAVTDNTLTVGALLTMNQEENDMKRRAGTEHDQLTQPLREMKKVVSALKERATDDRIASALDDISHKLDGDIELLGLVANNLRRVHGGFQSKIPAPAMNIFTNGLMQRRERFVEMIDSLEQDVRIFSEVTKGSPSLRKIATMISHSSSTMAKTLTTIQDAIDRAFPPQTPDLPPH